MTTHTLRPDKENWILTDDSGAVIFNERKTKMKAVVDAMVLAKAKRGYLTVLRSDGTVEDERSYSKHG